MCTDAAIPSGHRPPNQSGNQTCRNEILVVGPFQDTGHLLHAERLALDHVHHVREDLDGPQSADATAPANGSEQDVHGQRLDRGGALAVQGQVNVP